MTPHWCWNVCDWETVEKDQPREAQLPTCTYRKSGNELRKEVHIQQGGAKEETGHPRSRGTPCFICIKISKETAANSTQKDMSFTSFPFCNTRRAQNPNQPRLLSTSLRRSPSTTSETTLISVSPLHSPAPRSFRRVSPIRPDQACSTVRCKHRSWLAVLGTSVMPCS